MKRECQRSGDVAAAAMAGEFACAGGSELHRHLEECESCRDLALVVSAMRGERDRARREATAPSAGLVWWRAELRERQAAARRAAAPVTLVQAVAFVALLIVAGVTAWASAGWAGAASLTDLLPSMSSWSETSQSVADLWPALRWMLALGATAWLVIGPVALYLTLRRD